MSKLNEIKQELDDLFGELNRSTMIGDVNPESVAEALLEVMKLLGRVLEVASENKVARGG